MYITWLGHSCFRLESAGYGLVIDPYRVVAGYPPLRPTPFISATTTLTTTVWRR